MSLFSLSLESDLPVEDRIRAYEDDRDELLKVYSELHPRSLNRRPSDLVEGILTDVCLYFIHERPLPRGQLALCDAATKRILWNSLVEDFVDSDKVDLSSLRRSTMAHELGHVRLHQDELLAKSCISYQEEGRFLDSRAFQKEREADLYASVFLVPRMTLERESAFEFLADARAEGKSLKSGQIWYRVYQLSAALRVTPTLMCRSLETYGWICKKATKKKGFHELELL